MERAAFLSYLTRLVKDGKVVEQQAGDLLRKFDAGDIDDADLPLPLNEAITDLSDADVSIAIGELKAMGINL